MPQPLMIDVRRRCVVRVVLAAGFALALLPASAQVLQDKVIVITSFPKDLTTPFAQAFERKHRGTRVEVQNRNSAAAIAFIRETRSSPPDIFWASAPDAFEVLKKHELLQKYQPKAQGRSEEHTSELQSLRHLVCRLLLEQKN